jgi:hypothetical protein
MPIHPVVRIELLAVESCSFSTEAIKATLFFIPVYFCWEVHYKMWQALCPRGVLVWKRRTIITQCKQKYLSSFMKMTAFWNTAQYILAEGGQHFSSTYSLDHQVHVRGSMNLWNVGLLKRFYMTQYTRKLSPSYSPLWHPEISHYVHLIAACNYWRC